MSEYRFAGVLKLPDAQVLQGDDPDGVFVLQMKRISCGSAAAPPPSALFWSTHGGVFKVVETAVRQNEPPPLPGFNSTPFSGTTPVNVQHRSRGDTGHSPIFRSHPSRSGLKNVSVRSFPSSSGNFKGSLRMLA